MKPQADYLISDAKERLDWIVGFMCMQFRFVYTVLGSMKRIPVVDMKMPGWAKTMGVRVQSGTVSLYYDPEFVLGLTDASLAYVLYHEVLHILLHHCTSRKFDNAEIGNIAQDLAVNEIIPVSVGHCEPPRDKDGKLIGCFVSELKKEKAFADIESGQTAEYYYEFLIKNKNKIGKTTSFDQHGGHAEDEIASERIRALVNEIQSRDGWGNTSTGIQEIILAAQVVKINWRKELRQMLGNIAWPEKQATRKRPNRRTGFVHPGSKRLHLDRHLVTVDTSGSIDYGLLSQFLSIINNAAEEMPIDFMQFDCEKQTEPRPFEHRVGELTFLGRGGTNFKPVVDIVNERGYKTVIILTDGQAGEVNPPEHADVIWVLPNGCNPPVDWGKRIHMDKYA